MNYKRSIGIIKAFFLYGLFACIFLFLTGQSPQNIIVDSNYSFAEAVDGKNIPESILKNLVLIDVEYYSFDRKLHKGQLVIHKNLQKDILDIFKLIKEKQFPVAKVIPIVKYGWSDDKSMRDNNTSSFNYRYTKGTKVFSAHASGRAIDINPWLNPQLLNGKTIPAGAAYDSGKAGTITKKSFLVKEFKKRGWQWGGTWKSTKDYQHFEKTK
ncbi:MAG: M15 family metallopeptidase [Ignavibacteriaceae bacterium]